VNALLALINRVQEPIFRALAALVRGSTAFLARVLRRGKHRPWRKGI
jgi:hypothetical protein